MVRPWTKHRSIIRLPRVQKKKIQTSAQMQSYLEELRTQCVRDGMPQSALSWAIGLSIYCLFNDAITNTNIQRPILNDSK